MRVGKVLGGIVVGAHEQSTPTGVDGVHSRKSREAAKIFSISFSVLSLSAGGPTSVGLLCARANFFYKTY